MREQGGAARQGGRTYVVIGGAGAMGRITVRDLVETCAPGDEVVVADYDLEKAKTVASSFMADERYHGPLVRAAHVDVRDHEGTARALDGAFVVINSVQYQLNLDVMKAALAARCHYVDLGGLFHVTKRQLELHDKFVNIGRTAVCGMGAAPGITNILSRYGAERLDTVTEIHTRVASVDKSRYEPRPALAVSYSLKTILEEFSFQPAVFTKGRFEFVEPMSGDKPHRFPPPVGVQRPMYTIHSEVATLPLSYKDKGVREVSFKIAFDRDFTDKVRFLRDLGLGSEKPVRIGDVEVRPIDVTSAVAMSQPASRAVGKLRQYEVVRAVVKGEVKGKRATWIVDCHTRGMPEWGIGLDIDTGSPPAIAAQMLASGEIVRIGAYPPEQIVHPEAFFKHLKRRKMAVKARRLAGWDFPT